MRCSACASEIPQGKRFCGDCGAAVDAGDSATRTSMPDAPAGPGASGSRWSDSLEGGRFIPGTMLAGRYRIVGMLGRGGMGEVYRAEDLKLGQPVALKFLPEGLERDEARLQRLLQEVRVALRVTHPNVCRVHDVGEVDGQHYISMEYVDGENLATLLGRIGRLPGDKAVQIARQLCAGLAAAHEQGILHRDLKPANVMIDGRGRARITDFGLAGLATSFEGAELRAGTPAYMAPEQLAGKEVTVRSDIYALGLVLYELFTGTPAFESGAGPLRAREETTPTNPSDVVPGMDPVVERVILRCLDKDPGLRPPSALAVAAALPGGDPLAAALAAGETPSPEMVAAAGEEGRLRPAIAWACLAGVAALLGLALWVGGRAVLTRWVPLDRPVQVLQDRAREVVERFSHSAPALDTAHGFALDSRYLDHIAEHDRTADRWERLRSGQPPVLRFWYRQSPRRMIPRPGFALVRPHDPPRTVAGMVSVMLDTTGRLVEFEAVPHEGDAAAAAEVGTVDWSLLLAEAGLDTQSFTPVSPTRVPPVPTDARAAWEGTLPGHSDATFRVEAGAWGGRPVFFRLYGPWDREPPLEAPAPPLATRIAQGFGMGVLLAATGLSIFLARRNLRLGRGDRAGAAKLALYFVAVHVLVWAFWAHHVPDLGDEWGIFMLDTGYTLFLAAIVWLLYLALEPLVRRRWPDALISWNRLLAGRFRDPRVGRDVLIGSLAGSAAFLLISFSEQVPGWLGWPPATPLIGAFDLLLGARRYLPQLLDAPVHGVFDSMQALFLLVVLRVVLRKPWLAAAAFVALFTPAVALGGEYPWSRLLFGGVTVLLFTLVLMRFGLLALTVAVTIITVMPAVVLTVDFTAWYAGSSIAGVLACLLLAGYGFRTSLGGQSPFGSAMLED